MNPFNVPDALVHAVATKLLALLAFLSAVGGLSAALTKAVEDFSWIKLAFNRNFLTAWLEQRLASSGQRKARLYGLRGGQLKPPGPAVQGRVEAPTALSGAWGEMISLCAAGEDRALLELPVAQICGQLNSAAQITLAYPGRFPNLYQALTAGASPDDVTLVATAPPAAGEPTPAAIQARRDAQTRISNYIQRSVDALHIRLDQRWNWWQQVASFVFGAGITFAAMASGSITPASGVETVFKVVIAAIVSAFLAPIARNLTAAVKSWST